MRKYHSICESWHETEQELSACAGACCWCDAPATLVLRHGSGPDFDQACAAHAIEFGGNVYALVSAL